jgi:DNA-binding NarL/FixJ family response regulator
VTAVLVVDDHPTALAGLVYPLRERFEVLVAATVAEALAVLRRVAVAAVVLDLVLDVPPTELHRELLLRGTPVVVVSGIEGDAARAFARIWGAPALLKPVADNDLLAAVTDAAARNTSLETAPMQTAPDDNPQRPTMAPPAPDAPLPAPPAAPDGDSVSPLAATNPQVAIAEARFRTIRRVVGTLCLTGLAVLFELRGHTMPVPLVIALTAFGLGFAGLESALRKRPGVAAGGAAGLALLALGGASFDLPGASLLASLGAGAIPLVDLLADRVRS